MGHCQPGIPASESGVELDDAFKEPPGTQQRISSGSISPRVQKGFVGLQILGVPPVETFLLVGFEGDRQLGNDPPGDFVLDVEYVCNLVVIAFRP